MSQPSFVQTKQSLSYLRCLSPLILVDSLFYNRNTSTVQYNRALKTALYSNHISAALRLLICVSLGRTKGQSVLVVYCSLGKVHIGCDMRIYKDISQTILAPIN